MHQLSFGSLSKRFEVRSFKGPAFKGEPNELDNRALSFLPASDELSAFFGGLNCCSVRFQALNDFGFIGVSPCCRQALGFMRLATFTVGVTCSTDC